MADVMAEAKAICATIQALRDRISSLEEIVGLGQDDIALIIRCTGLTKREAEIVSVLRKRRVTLSPQTLYEVLYGGRPESDQPVESVVTVTVSTIRKKLRASGIAITTIQCVGYCMEEASRRRLTIMMNDLLADEVVRDAA